jgi:8-oxo-dGTP pyrophosphatase MutT (NUDIX family)
MRPHPEVPSPGGGPRLRRRGGSEKSPPFVAAVSVFVFRGDRLLAMRRAADRDAAPGAWEVVSGRLLAGEHPLAAARRECKEETGLEVAIEQVPITAYTAKRNRSDMLVVVYRGRSEAGEVVLSEEHEEAAWMTIEAFAIACPFPPLVAAASLAAGRGSAPEGAGPDGEVSPPATGAASIEHVIVWEFRVRAGREIEFEAAYGPEGDWARLFRRDPAYLGTELLRDRSDRLRYLTIDHWASGAANDAFRERWRSEYEALDRRCDALTEHEEPLGRYDAAPAAHRPPPVGAHG